MRPILLLPALLIVATPLAAQSRAGADAAKPSERAAGYAASIAVTPTELLVGRTGATSAGLPTPPQHFGSVLRFTRGADGRWTEAGAVAAADSALGDDFGAAIAVAGEWLAVGAPKHGETGAVYLFRRQGGAWKQVARLEAPQGKAGDEFGAAVALDEARLVIGAPGADSSRGTVYASRLDARSGRWTPVAKVASGAEVSDRFGEAVAVHGTRVAAGAPGLHRTTQSNPFGGGGYLKAKPGSAAVYVEAKGAWTEEGKLTAGADTVRSFGASVLLTATEAIVGAPRGARATGAAYVFARHGTAWQQVARLQPATPEPLSGFGWTVAMAGNDLLVGAPISDKQVGRLHAFRKGADGAWGPVQVIAPTSVTGNAMTGVQLAASGDVAAATAPMKDNGLGAVVVFAREPSGEWKEQSLVVDRPVEFAKVTGGERRCDAGRADRFGCRQVDLLAFLPISALGGGRGVTLNDVWGWTDAQTGREYALVGRSDGTAFVDVTNPSDPRYLGDLPLHAGARANMWRGIKVYKDHAFIVADGAGAHGMQVFDLTQLRDVKGAPVTFTETAHYDRLASAHTIALNEESGFAYAVGANGGGETCGGALHMIDVRDPRHPTFAGCFADVTTGNQRTGYTHENQCVNYRGPDARFTGREICFNNSETALGIADVTDKQAPKALSTISYPNVAYTHQGWLSEDQRYYFVNDEGDEMQGGTQGKTRTLIFDVQKLDEPVLAKEFFGTTAAVDHNLYVRGRYMFQSNYTAGLRVIDVSDPVNPRETAFFDTYPMGEDAPGFAGTWTNYPFFRSGTVVVTGIGEGLFVVRHRPEEPAVP